MVKQLHESLRRAILWLRARGGTRWCLQALLQLWRRFVLAISRLYLSNQEPCGIVEKPRSLLLTTDLISASRLPASHPLEEHIASVCGSTSSTHVSSPHSPSSLHLDIQELPQRQSTSRTLSGITAVSSPPGSPRGSLPLPYYCKDGPDSDLTKFEATLPSHSRRYDSRSSPSLTFCSIPAGPLSVNRTRERALPAEWREYIHPEGQLYFVRSWGAPPINIITEAYVYEPELRDVISNFAEAVLTRAIVGPWLSDVRNVELLVEVDEEGSACSHYFIDHENTVIFWLDEINTADFDIRVSGLGHLRIRIQEEYWLHQEYFPSHRAFSENHERELVATLAHSCIDTMSCDSSTSPFGCSRIESMLGVMNNLKNNVGNRGQRNWIVARSWNEIYTARFINYYGERDARLFRTQMAGSEDGLEGSSILVKISSSILMKIIFWLFFDAPSTHLNTLRKLYVDEVLYTEAWVKYMEGMCTDWHDMILWATVLLTANMSFLAIFNSTDQVIQENRAVTCSLVSTLSSTISIVIGLLHVRKHRPLTTWAAAEGAQYLRGAKHSKLGLRPLAIVYSLPYGFLVWAMITYTTAILLFAFNCGVNAISQAFIGVIAVGLGAMLAWVITYFWKDEVLLMNNLRKLRNTLRYSPVALSRSVGKMVRRSHNPEAATISIVRQCFHKSTEAGDVDDPQVKGV